MLALATALIEDPVLLVADELSLGLAPMVTEEVYRQLAEIRSRGTALLIVEQQVSHALELCDDVVLLRRGAVAWSGPSQDASAVVSDILGVAGPAESGPSRASP
jgi:branched-chain amino acid transport system ATP-binding protein